MVLDIPSGLTKLRCNFIERIAFHEVEPQGLTLVLRQCFKHLLKASVSQPSLNRVLKLWSCCSRIGEVACCVVDIEARIEVARSQIAAAGDRAAGGHFENPKTCPALRTLQSLS